MDKLENFPFDNRLLACKNIGIFPDLAIKLNKDKSIFSGGELVELKDSQSYSVSSFNSTIPAGTKDISKFISGENSRIYRQMEKAGNDIYSLPVRGVFYLVRGKKNNNCKVCLLHGSFFETVRVDDLISKSFMQVLEDNLKESDTELNQNIKDVIHKLFSEQENFSTVRNVEKASVKLRFRIMTEVKAEGNILNSNKYPEIIDNSLNFILPCHNDDEEKEIINKFNLVFNKKERKSFNIFKIKHHLNGYFIIFQNVL
ncbi:MAG: hypothetical protein CVT88_01550 [Candidatus Altiarchaeales archaeon HGW-Altiarchaeales-1]|nr:MAG: hypothetical protein CVT88_01550 [Candidatus Altiarchaeales archaeon HGW-Altiarchaeales-1]